MTSRIWSFSAAVVSRVRFAVLLPATIVLGCSRDGAPIQDDAMNEAPHLSRSYAGHAEEIDADLLVATLPAVVGTRVDDCQTCHSGRVEGGLLVESSCDHCHQLLLQDSATAAFATLNPFGRDYLEAGRSLRALGEIRHRDSDGDGYSNEEELLALRFPGSSLSRPGQSTAEYRTLLLEELSTIPPTTQLLLANNTQQQFDDYVTYSGYTLEEVLVLGGVDLDGATGITVISPDGYLKSLPIQTVVREFPQPIFLPGLSTDALGEECGFVRYQEALPDYLFDAGAEGEGRSPVGEADQIAAGRLIQGKPRLMLAFERNGEPLDPFGFDAERGRANGEGPLRLVVPQAAPGPPDRGQRYSPSGCGDGFDFNPDADHNAGAMVRGVIAIRIDPVPAGKEEFDYIGRGWALLEAGELVIYGHGVG